MAEDGGEGSLIQDFIENELVEDHFKKEIASFRSPAISFDDIAVKLIADNFLLTALELHTELLESGQELPRLRDFFSNPGNFERQAQEKPELLSPGLPRTSSVQTFDSLDFARYSDDGEKQVDERVAVLEFELRKAKETIKSLRANLTVAAESEGNTPDANVERPVVDEPIKPHEKRALNFLVNEYLLKNNYKLTSITLSDENEEQDFEDWDDVGLNIAKPPELLCLYRDFAHHTYPHTSFHSLGVQVNLDEEDVIHFAVIQPKLEEEIASLKDSIELLTYENNLLQGQVKTLEENSRLDVSNVATSSSITSLRNSQVPSKDDDALVPPTQCEHLILEDNAADLVLHRDSDNLCETQTKTIALTITDSAITLPESSPKVLPALVDKQGLGTYASASIRKTTSLEFHKALLDLCSLTKGVQDNRLAVEVSAIVDCSEKVVTMLGRCLPYIVPNVILAKREELIPVILCTITLHPDAKERDVLLNILFNLIKRPDDEQRQMILTGFSTIAQQLGPTRVEAELLPQCWEQIAHKYTERRLLVAESCGVLAPFVSNDIRSSLVLSMLQQMLTDDKSEPVRETVVKSLALVMSYVDDMDKFSQGFELLTIALQDPCDKVIFAASQVLLPSFAAWALELGNLEAEVIPSVLKRLEESVLGLLSAAQSGNLGGLGSVEDEQHFVVLCSALRSLVPWLFLSVAWDGPFTDQGQDIILDRTPEHDSPRLPLAQSPLDDIFVILGDRRKALALVRSYQRYTSEEWFESWAKFDWMNKELLPRLTSVVERLPIMYSSAVRALAQLFQDLGVMFGENFTKQKVKPRFQSCLSARNPDCKGDPSDSPLEKTLVPVYIVGVLATFFKEDDRKELSNFLVELMSTLSLCHLPLDSIRVAMTELSLDATVHELLLSALWEGVVHNSPAVRCSAASLFELLVGNVSEYLLAVRVVPALVTLASDPDVSVRIATVPSFGSVVAASTQKEVLDKVRLQFQSFIEDPFYQDHRVIMVEMIRTFGRISANADAKFREDFILPRLATMAANNAHLNNEKRRLSIAVALLEAYTSLSCCFMSDQLIAEFLLPGLRCLLVDMQQLNLSQSETIAAMILEFETKVETPRPAERSSSIVSSMGMSPSGMDDVRNRFTKMFSGAKTQGRAIPQIFHQISKK